MKKYIGTKNIKAQSMNRLAYNNYRNWNLPSDENGEDKGYLVEYLDGGEPNHSDHKGYISWCPEEQFENAYKIAETFSDRLLIETQNLAENLNKLNSFMPSQFFIDLDRVNKDLLYEQQRAMSTYLQILSKRLELANIKFKHK